MKNNLPRKMKTFRSFGLILCLAALPLLLGATGCATGSDRVQSERTDVNDQGISSRVRVALAKDTHYKFGDITVDTYMGVVQLNGSVNSRDQKNRAGELARRVGSVRDVFNNITVQESLN